MHFVLHKDMQTRLNKNQITKMLFYKVNTQLSHKTIKQYVYSVHSTLYTIYFINRVKCNNLTNKISFLQGIIIKKKITKLHH